jgi:hypothetical protein
MTISRVLNNAGLVARKKRRTFFLSEKHKKDRFLWAKKYFEQKSNFWDTVIWSDESKMFS